MRESLYQNPNDKTVEIRFWQTTVSRRNSTKMHKKVESEVKAKSNDSQIIEKIIRIGKDSNLFSLINKVTDSEFALSNKMNHFLTV